MREHCRVAFPELQVEDSPETHDDGVQHSQVVVKEALDLHHLTSAVRSNSVNSPVCPCTVYVSLRLQKSQGSQTGHMVTLLITPSHTSRVGTSRVLLQVNRSHLSFVKMCQCIRLCVSVRHHASHNLSCNLEIKSCLLKKICVISTLCF